MIQAFSDKVQFEQTKKLQNQLYIVYYSVVPHGGVLTLMGNYDHVGKDEATVPGVLGRDV